MCPTPTSNEISKWGPASWTTNEKYAAQVGQIAQF